MQQTGSQNIPRPILGYLAMPKAWILCLIFPTSQAPPSPNFPHIRLHAAPLRPAQHSASGVPTPPPAATDTTAHHPALGLGSSPLCRIQSPRALTRPFGAVRRNEAGAVATDVNVRSGMNHIFLLLGIDTPATTLTQRIERQYFLIFFSSSECQFLRSAVAGF